MLDVYLLQVFNGLSVGSILLLVALGLAFSFGLMGVINMAHGEFIMVGAYAPYVLQQLVGGAANDPLGLTFIAANCYAAIGVIDYPERFCSDCDKATGERMRTGTKARLHEYWSMFAGNFPFLKNGHVGALELLAAVVSRWSGARAHLKANRPVFHGQLERIEEDPRIAAVFKRHWP